MINLCPHLVGHYKFSLTSFRYFTYLNLLKENMANELRLIMVGPFGVHFRGF